jgi:23S rRNA maturation mini-RNase III
VLADTEPELLEALMGYLELRSAEQRAEQLRQRLRDQIG